MTDFTPTHVVPDGGMQAWNQPDPSAAPVADLGAGTELRVTEERGAWAAVLASNGWTGWVDGRRLVSRPAAAVSATPPEPEVAAEQPAPEPEMAPESVQPEPAPDPVLEVTAPGPPGFSATHVVPQSGMQAWASPDPGAEPVATLHGGTLLRLDEQLGAWGRVAADNGWTGWVDVRRLVVF